MSGEVDLFNEQYLANLTSGKRSGYMSVLNGEDEDTILNVDREEYIDYLENRFLIEPLKIGFGPDDYAVERVKSYHKSEFRIHFPVGGNIELLNYRPSNYIDLSIIAHIDESEDSFWVRLPIDEENPDKSIIEESAAEVAEKIRTNYISLNTQIEEFNEGLRDEIGVEFDKLKRKYQDEFNVLDQLDINVIERDDKPETFSIPSPERRSKIEVEKPETPSKSSSKLDPTLSDAAYEEILNAVNDIGKGFERSPLLFEGKGEEDLRDFILFFLQMNFVGEATGETFNNKGKTDILLRHEGDNVFIAECSIWRGQKRFLEKINQLNRYLTWRDTKTAIVIFTRNKDISGVHERIVDGMESHPQYKEYVERKDKSWFQYKFHFEGDSRHFFQLAVLVFQLRE